MTKPDFEKMAKELAEKSQANPMHAVPCKECGQPCRPPAEGEGPWGWRICDSCGLSIAQTKTGIRDRYLAARIADLNDAMQLAVEPLETKSGYLWGEYGVGKTHALSAIATALVEKHHRPFRFVAWGDLVREWRSTFNRKSERTEAEFMNYYSTGTRLFLDDLSDEMGDDSHAVKVMLCDLVDARYSRKLHTVITSNLDLKTLAGKFSRKLSDRIYEDGVVVKLIGKNRRVGADGG